MLLNKKEAYKTSSGEFIWLFSHEIYGETFYIANAENISQVSSALYEYSLAHSLVDPDSDLWFNEEQLTRCTTKRNFIEDILNPGCIREAVLGATIPVWQVSI
jgi:hypothetical protein